MATTTRTIEMANFASDGDSMTKTVSLPDYVDLQNVSVDVEAAGDLNGSTEDFDYYLDGSLEGGELSTGVQDCTYRDVWTNRDVTNYFDGKSSVQLQVNSSPATDEGFDCTGTAIKVKSVFTIDYVNTSPPSSPQSPSSTYIADDQIDFSFDAPSDWGGETGSYDVEMLRDSGSWSDPAGGPSSISEFNYFGDKGHFNSDCEDLGSQDGFDSVHKADATENDTYEDIFTNEFVTDEFDGSGSDKYLYIAFAAKWNEYPDSWDGGLSSAAGEAIVNPDPDPDNYQLYVARSDGQNSRDEYFRIYYSSNNTTGVAYIADPIVWKGKGWEIDATDAEIVGDSADRTVCVSHEYGPNSDSSYDSVVGIDSSFQFRVRAQNSAGSSSWTYSDTVYTTPIPPHNPSVSRPDANTFDISWELTTNILDYYTIEFREDSGSGYGSWGGLTNGNTSNLFGTPPSGTNVSVSGDTITVRLVTGSEDYQYGGTLDEDKRYQFRLNYTRRDNASGDLNSDFSYADYGNEGNVYFEDDFESGDLSAWDSNNLAGDTGVRSSGDPSNDIGITGSDEGSYWFYGEGVSDTNGTWIQKNLGDISGETDVLVKCAFGVGSLDNGSENFGISWYDGSTWQSLDHKDWKYNKQGWVELQATVPSSWLSSDNRIRIGTTTGSGMYGGDQFGVDRVVVSDILHEYTKPAAPTNVSASGTSNSHEVSVSWDKQVASLPEAFQEVRVRVDGSGDPRDKYNVNLSSSATFNVNDGFDHTVPQRDGEQYEIRVDSLFQQFRHGTTEDYPRSVSGDTTAITKLPAPTSLSVSNIGTNSTDLSWTDNHDYGDAEVQFKLDSDTTWTTDSTISIGTESETLTSLSEATVYDARVLASTEHTTTEDI